MYKVDLWKRGYHLFHRNEYLNIIIQANLLVKYHGYYACIYDIDVNVETDLNTSSVVDNITGDNSNSTHQLVVRESFNPNDNTFHLHHGFTLIQILLHHPQN